MESFHTNEDKISQFPILSSVPINIYIYMYIYIYIYIYISEVIMPIRLDL
jgi:hypothetical protein